MCDLDSSPAVRFVLEPGVVLKLVCLGTPRLSFSCRFWVPMKWGAVRPLR